MATTRKTMRRRGRPAGSKVTRRRTSVRRSTSAAGPGMVSLKEQLAREIGRIIETRQLNQTEAAEIVGDAPSQISLLLGGHLRGFSIERMIRTLLRLGRDVELVLRPTPGLRTGKLGMKRIGG